MLVYRFGRWRYGVRPAFLRKILSGIYKLLFKFVQIVASIELPCEAEVGHNFVIEGCGGTVVNGYAKIGENCRMRSGSCVGMSRVGGPGVPVIGNNVEIGPGAKVLGDITIGDNVYIGANSVVVRDLPSDCEAIGVPAVITLRGRRSGVA